MRTSLDLCFCLLTLCGVTPVLYGVRVVVEEDSDAVLPCLISTKEDITGKTFQWMKDGRKEVFIYRSGSHSNNGFIGQDEQFRGRVSHFQDQLKNGNASLKIKDTKMADSGSYRCIFPLLQPNQTFNIELVVGASPKPYVTTLDETKDWSLLQCEVQGASPKPKVEWQDSSGNILPAEEPQVSEKGGRYYVTIKTTVTKTGRYRCVVTQEEISHQIHSETFVQLNEDQSREVKQWRSTATIVIAVLVAVVLLVVAVVCWRRRSLQQRRFRSKEGQQQRRTSQNCYVTVGKSPLNNCEEGRQQSLPSQDCYATVDDCQQESLPSQESPLYETVGKSPLNKCDDCQQESLPSQDSHLYENLRKSPLNNCACHVHPPDDPKKSGHLLRKKRLNKQIKKSVVQ